MKVKELIELLSKCDQELHVLTADYDNWFYDLEGEADEVNVFEGREDNEKGEKVLVIY